MDIKVIVLSISSLHNAAARSHIYLSERFIRAWVPIDNCHISLRLLLLLLLL
jgi:hypothetical protein